MEHQECSKVREQVRREEKEDHSEAEGVVAGNANEQITHLRDARIAEQAAEIGLRKREDVAHDRREVGEAVYLANEDETRLRFFAAGTYLGEKTRRFLAEVGDLMAAKSAQQRLVNEGQEQMQRLAEEEGRLRREA